MKCEKLIWMAFMTVAFLGTTSEARLRRKSSTVNAHQADDPKIGVQNQQGSFNYEEYGNYDYTDAYEDNNCTTIYIFTLKLKIQLNITSMKYYINLRLFKRNALYSFCV